VADIQAAHAAANSSAAQTLAAGMLGRGARADIQAQLAAEEMKKQLFASVAARAALLPQDDAAKQVLQAGMRGRASRMDAKALYNSQLHSGVTAIQAAIRLKATRGKTQRSLANLSQQSQSAFHKGKQMLDDQDWDGAFDALGEACHTDEDVIEELKDLLRIEAEKARFAVAMGASVERLAAMYNGVMPIRSARSGALGQLQPGVTAQGHVCWQLG